MQSQKKIIASSKTVKVGPWGGNGGSTWDDGSYNGVRKITMTYGKCIDSIMIEYDKNGKPVLAEKHGGIGGNHTIQIELKYPDEFLTTISGHYAPVVRGGSPVIRSLTFKSNQGIFGPFGTEEGTPFSFPMDGGTIVGFCGRSGWYLDAIGLHLSPLRTANIYDTVQYKLHKLGSMAYKSLGRRYGQHESPVDAKTQKAL
ncbi:jacalin-related lectin 19 [Typha angustifolia]|uniref:jacalin-related lectin 19 n=1 Tax=Typha angustifolia TaxID=59011 RepID=UPI003C304191